MTIGEELYVVGDDAQFGPTVFTCHYEGQDEVTKRPILKVLPEGELIGFTWSGIFKRKEDAIALRSKLLH